MNKITGINGFYCDIGSDELIELLNRYGGPLNDFYISKDLGIILDNIYNYEFESFPFRNRKFQLEDTFLNEYSVGPEEDIKNSEVLILKNTLDVSKIRKDVQEEQYILNNFKKMNFDGKTFLCNIFYNLFGKQKLV